MSIDRWATRSAVVALTLVLLVGNSVGRAAATPIGFAETGTTVEPAIVVPPFEASPDVMVFPGRAVSTTSPVRTVTFSNTTSGPQTIATVDIHDYESAPSAATDFAISAETCTTAPIPAAGTCTVDLTFTPGALGVRGASLHLSDAVPSVVLSFPLEGIGQAASSLTWSSPKRAGSTPAWSYGSELARSVTSTGTSYLQAVYTTDRVGGRNVTDHGPYLGVYYVRSSSATGTSWSTPKRLNQSTRHGDEATIATSGKYVYVAWTSQTRYIHFSPTAPRAVYIRVNSNYGKGTWRSVIRLTSSTGRIFDPHVAAAGKYVYVSYTDSNTGKIRLKISSDHGRTWRTRTIGSTTLAGSIGRQGGAVVAASGSTVAVAWAASGIHKIAVRRSANHGTTWAGAEALAGRSIGLPEVAVSGRRVVVGWPTDQGIEIRVRTTSGWGPVRRITAPDTATPYEGAYSAALALNGSSRIGVAWSACWAGCSTNVPQIHLIWTESADQGVSWLESRVIGSGSEIDELVHDGAAVVWPATGRRTVIWNAYSPNDGSTSMFIRSASDTP